VKPGPASHETFSISSPYAKHFVLVVKKTEYCRLTCSVIGGKCDHGPTCSSVLSRQGKVAGTRSTLSSRKHCSPGWITFWFRYRGYLGCHPLPARQFSFKFHYSGDCGECCACGRYHWR